MRLFVALAMPPEVSAELAALQGGLDGARWVDPDDLHLTLRFVGEVDGGTAEDLAAALQSVRAPAFDLRLSGFGHFGNDRRLRALWAAVDPQPLLDHLQGRVEAAARRAGLEPETRRFVPHVTLARFQGGAVTGEALTRWMQRNGPFAAGPFPVREAVLFESFLGRDGPRYEQRLSIPLEKLPDADDWDDDWESDADVDGPADG